MKKMAHPSENHFIFSPSSGCLVYGKSPWSSPGGFLSFSLIRETQFYCRHQFTQLSTRISLFTCCPSLKCLPLSSTVKQCTTELSESERQCFKKSFLNVSRENFANTRNNFDRERQPISVLQSIVLCTNH